MTTKYLTVNDIGTVTITATAVSPDGLSITQLETINSLNTVGAPPRRDIIENPELPFTQPTLSITPPVNQEGRFTRNQLITIETMRRFIKLRRVKFRNGIPKFENIKNPLWREALILEGKIKRPAGSTQLQEIAVQTAPQPTEQQILSGQTGDPEIQAL